MLPWWACVLWRLFSFCIQKQAHLSQWQLGRLFLSKVWPCFRRPSSLPAVLQLCCYCYSLPFPSEPHNIPGWSGIVWWMLSISLCVHAEVFLRRRSARDAFYFFTASIKHCCFFTQLMCPLFAVVQCVFLYNFFHCIPVIYLFVRATNCCLCGHTHTLITHGSRVCCDTHNRWWC